MGKCSVEIAKANSFTIIFNTSPKEGEPDPKWTKTGDQPAEEEKWGHLPRGKSESHNYLLKRRKSTKNIG